MSDEKTLSQLLGATGFSENFSDQLFSDLSSVETLLSSGVRSETRLPQELALYIVKTGGKRLRPLLLCLCFRSKTIHKPRTATSHLDIHLHTLAAVAEWVHTATLFHDDVIDASVERRGHASAHILHGNKTAILVGDFVYAEAFAKLMDSGLLSPSQRLAHAVKKLVEGELLQHQVSLNRSLNLSDYNKIAESKTGALFAWCIQTGHWLAENQLSQEAWELGNRLGTAFQIADDFIDTFEFNFKTAAEADIQGWIEGAPPLPLLVAQNIFNSEIISALWSNLKNADPSKVETRLQLGEILSYCSKPEVKKECFNIFKKEYDSAVSLAKELELHEHLSWALDVILNRAVTGLEQSHSSVNEKFTESSL
jgi:octaprenyl-diphosphate synthase